MNTADEAIKAFKATGDTQTVEAPSMEPTPSIKLHDEDGENVGQFVQGKYLIRRTGKSQNGEVVYIDIRLENTNAKATVKKGKDYVPAEIKAGDIISVYASRRLDRQLSKLEPGTDFIAVYKGMVKVKTAKGRTHAHDYEVQAKTDATLTPADVDYIKSRSGNKKEDVDVKAENEKTDAEAEANLNALDAE